MLSRKKFRQHLALLAILTYLLPACAASTLSEKIVQTASSSKGKEMWYGYGLRKGTLGCAAAVCNVLKNSGITVAKSAAVSIMRNQILHGKLKCQELIIKDGSKAAIDDRLLLKTAKPGDVLVAFLEPPTKPNLGGAAHCGIMGNETYIYTNDWNDGIWKLVDIHQMFDYYRYIRLLRFTE